MKHSMSAGDAAMQSRRLKCTLISSTAKKQTKNTQFTNEGWDESKAMMLPGLLSR